MLFNSYIFIFAFFPITFLGYFILNKMKIKNNNRLAKVWLIVASFYFYGFFHKSYVLIILSSIIVNYTVSKLMLNKKYKKLFFIFGIVFNILMIGYFKYYDFFISNINILFRSNFRLLKLMLPLGISFFTFQQISYLIDSYREDYRHNFIDYALFVSFFPQLIAGPIVLSHEMLPQFEAKDNKRINYKNLYNGLCFFSIGLIKKTFIADSISSFAETGFDHLTVLTMAEAWLSSISYTLQLYFDFSGYCDMAIGIALAFNIVLPLNFNSPYKSRNIQEFWRRWHVTLGRFLGRYLYIPLGGNRKGHKRTLINLGIVFLVSGIWHGAGWTFIIWGILHGIAIIIDKILDEKDIKFNKFIGIFFTFNIVNILWVFFRSENLTKAMVIIKSMFDFSTFSKGLTENFENYSAGFFHMSMLVKIVLIVLILVFIAPNSLERIKSKKINKFRLYEMSIYFVVGILFLDKVSKFLYFNF